MLLPNYANIMIVNEVTTVSNHGHRSNFSLFQAVFKLCYFVD